jgi:hypothetical protein
VRRDADGRIAAGWHIPPLGGGWEALYVPASVIGGVIGKAFGKNLSFAEGHAAPQAPGE